MEKALSIRREDTLCERNRTLESHTSAPTFITKYNHQALKIQKILKKHWEILKSDPTLSKFLGHQPQIIFTRAPDLQLTLASTIKSPSTTR
ncbi:Hypothetical predicted protein, partial [Pelobates cultripes]